MFPLEPHAPLDLINAPKVAHHCYGRGQAEEMRLLGVKRVRASALAAPAEYLKAEEPCAVRDRLAFVGNPGLATAAERRGRWRRWSGVKAWPRLRRIARQEMLEWPGDRANRRPGGCGKCLPCAT